ncbi:MAG: phage tail protein [Gammaproteobacteria bacterium]
MADGKREDPVRAFNFQVSLMESSSSLGSAVTTIAFGNVIDKPVAGFNECTGLEMSLDIEEYQEGGNNGTVLKFPSRAKWSNITLKKGLTTGTDLWDWFFGFVEGRGERKDGVITLLDGEFKTHTAWHFVRAIPIRYTAPSLNAQQSNVAVESIEIAHEGLYQLSGARGLASAVSAVASAASDLAKKIF